MVYILRDISGVINHIKSDELSALCDTGCHKYDYYNHTNVFKPGYNIQIGVSDGIIRNIYISSDGNDINTYIPLEFPKSAIKKIVLGPMYQKNYFEVEIAIKGVLGYDRAVEIVTSESGFRGIR